MSTPWQQRQLDRLHRRIRHCVKCRLCESRTSAVPGEGPAPSRVMLVGEAPGAREDAEGRPFVGPAGRFLDEMLTAAGLTRERVFLTNSVKCRPPGNRAPFDDELKTCKENWLDQQIDLVSPRIIVLLGATPIRQIFGKPFQLSKLHGRVCFVGARRYLLTYHPAAAKRFPAVRKMMRADFRVLKRIVHGS